MRVQDRIESWKYAFHFNADYQQMFEDLDFIWSHISTDRPNSIDSIANFLNLSIIEVSVEQIRIFRYTVTAGSSQIFD